MIDLSTPDTLLYDSAVLSSYIRKNTKESFGYIFFDNIDYITKLYNDNRMRDVTYKNILDWYYVKISDNLNYRICNKRCFILVSLC